MEEIENDNTITRTDEKTYTAIIPLANIQEDYFDNIKISFKWQIDSGNETGDIEYKETDSSVLQIPISVKASQYIGETITEYTE